MGWQGQRPSQRAGAVPCSIPRPCVPAVAPDLHAPPEPALVAGNPTPQDLFSGPVRPLGAPYSPNARCHDPALDAVRQQPGPGGGGGGREAQPAHKGPFVELPVACGPARTHRVGARDLEILVLRGVEGAQPGPPLLWLGAGLTQPTAGGRGESAGPWPPAVLSWALSTSSR